MVVPLRCQVKHYDWGSKEPTCTVRRMAAKHGGVCNGEACYAELWIGNHPNGASVSAEGASPEVPFMLKFLSVGKALSLQLHPDAMFAAALHACAPNAYSDPHAKPEMAVALTTASLLYGFRPDWRETLARYPEIPDHQSLEALVIYLLNWGTGLVTYKAVLKRLEAAASPDATDRLFLALAAQHPGDAGALLALFMNHVRLVPGEGIAIPPNVLHAYLSGDLVECMASSDNVVRAGLTTKARDVNTLLACLSYEAGTPVTLLPVQSDPHTFTYVSGFEEFDLVRLEVPHGQTARYACRSNALLAVTGGSGTVGADCVSECVSECDVLGADSGEQLAVTADASGTLTVWVAVAPQPT